MSSSSTTSIQASSRSIAEITGCPPNMKATPTTAMMSPTTVTRILPGSQLFAAHNPVMISGEIQYLLGAGPWLQHPQHRVGRLEMRHAHIGDVVAQRGFLVGGGDVAAGRIEREHG